MLVERVAVLCRIMCSEHLFSASTMKRLRRINIVSKYKHSKTISSYKGADFLWVQPCTGLLAPK